MATPIKRRIERLETEMRFKVWVYAKRFRDSLSEEQLEVWVATGQRPDLSQPPPGLSPIDKMDREMLRKLWMKDEQGWAGRNHEDLFFYCVHGHWQEQGCGPDCRNSQERNQILGNAISLGERNV